MELMSNALKSGLGDYIRVLITKFNSSNFKMMFTGILVTVITQSTGATTVMLMSFVEANIMKFAETVPVILGACIGSSVTSQIIAFDVAGYAIVPVIVGFFMKSRKNDSIRDTGNAIFGFGLVFFGMQLLGKSVSILKDIPEFTNVIASADNPLLGLLAGTIGTCIMQSTGMFAGILMVFAKEGLIDISQAYPLVIGSTLGTCLLIVIASVGGTTQSKRTMMAHVLTKCAGAVIFMALMPVMVALIEWVCEAVHCSPERQIANIHLIFNIGEAFVLLPFCSVFVKVIEKWVTPTKNTSKDKVKTSGYLKYIDLNVISVPQTAIESSISETAMLIKLCSRIFDKASIVFEDYNPDNIDAKRLNQKTLKRLADKQQTFKYVSCIVDTVMGGLVPLYDKLCRLDMTFSTEGVSEIKVFIWAINNHFRELFTAIEKHDAKKIASVAQAIELTRHNTESLRMSHIKRLWNDDHQAASATHEVHTQLIDTLASITAILSSITATFAKSIITDDGKK